MTTHPAIKNISSTDHKTIEMTTEAKHTSTPWASAETYPPGDPRQFVIHSLTAAGRVPSECKKIGYVVSSKEDAAFIVKACNHFDELVAALKPLAFSSVNHPPPGVSLSDWKEAVIAARAALSKVQT